MRLTIGTQYAVDVWLAIAVFWLGLAAFEIGAIVTHRWHTLSWIASKHRWLAWTLGILGAATGLGFFAWFVFWHTLHWIPW